jgi:haloalkane dehalogenase
MTNLQAGSESVDWRALYPFQSHWHRPGTGFGRLHYLDEVPRTNNGAPPPTLLFVHGNPTWSFHWRALIAALRNRYRCVAPDHIGCGLSDKPQLQLRLSHHVDHLTSLVVSLDLRHITLVAQDWGGAIGLAAMLGMPERFERIILFNTGAFPPQFIPWRIRVCRIPVLGRLAVQGANLFSRAALRMTLARKQELDPAVAAGYLAPYDTWSNRRAVYGFVRDIPAPRRRVRRGELASKPQKDTLPSTAQLLAETEQRLPTLADRPALLIWGMRDWCFRPDCIDRFAAAWPRAQIHRLSDVGHWVVEDAPEDTLSCVQQFLEHDQPTDLPRSTQSRPILL